MSRKHNRGGGPPPPSWGGERTLADAEEDALLEDGEQATGGQAVCACGSEEFLLEAYMAVVAGAIQPKPVEVEQLTCPQCGREYEAIEGEGGRILRGEFLGYADLE